MIYLVYNLGMLFRSSPAVAQLLFFSVILNLLLTVNY